MHLVSFDHNRRERTGWTNILTGTTAYASLLVDGWYVGGLLVVLIQWHHLDGTSWAVAGTVTAFHPIGYRYAVLLDEYGMTYLDG